MTVTCGVYYIHASMDAIIAAMDGEIAAVRAAMEHRTEEPPQDVGNVAEGGARAAFGNVATGSLYGRPVVVACSGVGKVMAAMCAQHIISTYQPARIILLGIAGALHEKLSIGDIVLGEDLLQYDLDATALGFAVGEVPYTPYRFLHSDPDMLATAALVHSELGAVHRGRVLSGDRFVSNLGNADHGLLHLLRDELAGDAVEMEGAALAMVATMNRIPFLIIRTISDHVTAIPSIRLTRFLRQVSQNNVRFVAALLDAPVPA